MGEGLLNGGGKDMGVREFEGLKQKKTDLRNAHFG